LPADAAPAENNAELSGAAGDGVTNRVAGMSMKATLLEHKEAVTAMVCFQQNNRHWMISSGWDRRICIWDLNTLKLHDIFKNNTASATKEELAADGIILSLDYSPERNEFGYTSSDKVKIINKQVGVYKKVLKRW
jgi:WD40 repeat protein